MNELFSAAGAAAVTVTGAMLLPALKKRLLEVSRRLGGKGKEKAE